jgi:hypothetical protein
MNADITPEVDLWDEAECNLILRGQTRPERRQHSPTGRNGCTPGDCEECSPCAANVRVREAYREGLFAEMARLRAERAHS